MRIVRFPPKMLELAGNLLINPPDRSKSADLPN
jgi:hypothetical protein